MQPATKLIVSLILLSLLAGCGGSEGQEPAAAAPINGTEEGYVLTGRIEDETGAPVAGAKVTADGVAAEGDSGADGSFTVNGPYSLDQMTNGDYSVLVTVDGEGFEPFEVTATASGEGPEVELSVPIILTPVEAPTYLVITTHQNGGTVLLGAGGSGAPRAASTSPPACTGATTIAGAAGKQNRETGELRLLVVVDASGSTEKIADSTTGKTIFETEIDAALALVEGLEDTVVGVVRFAAEAALKQPFTSDLEQVAATLEAMRLEGPEKRFTAGAGTNFDEALKTVRQAFQNEFPPDNSANDPKVALMLSDGIPTLPTKPGTTQERMDVKLVLNRAKELANTSIFVHTFAIGIDGEAAKLTTMPTLSAITGGAFHDVLDLEELEATLVTSSMVGMGEVTILNKATGETVTVQTDPDGSFEANITLIEGPQTIEITAWDEKKEKFVKQNIEMVGECI